MKKILLLLLFVATGAFAQADKVKFTAKIENRNSDSLVVRSRNFTKTLKADKKGAFADAFAVPEAGLYQLFDGAEYATLYLKNGYDLSMTMDAKKFDESIAFKGKGAKENNLLAQKTIGDENLVADLSTASTDEAAVDKFLIARNAKYEAALADKDIDAEFRTMVSHQLKAEGEQLKGMAEQSMKANKMKGQQSPTFAYENYKGGTTKLEDFKGKYVYIDVWATWCGPCRQEIPYLQEVEKKYEGKNIEFVSLSIDTKKDYEKWRKMVGDKSLGGVQIIADNDWKSAFTTAYGVNSIPRFILIDPQGKVVEADAKRPSDPALQAQLDKLLK
ncbi:TlpA family protein disulfide reductase [Flavobacterium subsaxonicum]|uniref:Thioredoxin n=1 Tax=Flavobacterium subsaxonicum WB 4.1-42 = DSM 21790 TaxID=1121898 RepID=A0A0A2MLB7_9FLAO|nr:TlpA disulfide reductase family protein [Flavobacterium subsaxonicum]KGO92248.1 thioredoxin [Flavobacterium subsaxonicum WB 4.1-42 = DSM 21790]